MLFTVNHKISLWQGHKVFTIILLLAGYLSVQNFRNHHSPENKNYSMLLFCKEGYDARTGKWVNKKPGPASFSISPEVYQMIKNWYATDSGANNPNNLPIMAPKEGYSYIYTPYKDKLHPNVHGMSIQGENGYKGYWYADDLSKVTDSSDANGQAVPLPPPKVTDPPVEYGGYDARTGNWVHTQPSDFAFAVSQGTYLRVKNWFATAYGTNNPLGLTLEVPKEDYTYLFVPFKDPKHPGIIGMSFQGDVACKGYWYADYIGETQDTVVKNAPVPANSNTTPDPTQTAQPTTNQQQSVPPQSQNPQQTQQNSPNNPPVTNPSSEGNQPK